MQSAERKRCGAKTRSGEPCKTWAMPNGRCRMHNGGALKGLAHPSTIHGRYSKDLPTRLLVTYQQAVSDPELLNMSAEIALTEARLSDLMRRVDKGESDRLWRELKATYRAMQDAQRAKDRQEVARLLNELGSLITHGHADVVAWSEVMTLIDTRRKLVDSEQKRRVAMQTMVRAEDATLLFRALVDVVHRHVSDKSILASITQEFSKLTAGGDSQ